MGGPGCLRLSTSLPSQPGSLQGDGPRLSQNDPNCTGLAKHALVLVSGQSVSADSRCSTSTARSGDTTVQRTNAPGSQESEPSCMVLERPLFRSKVSRTKWQQELRLLRDYQQEQSTNQSGAFLSNGAGLKRWTPGRPL